MLRAKKPPKNGEWDVVSRLGRVFHCVPWFCAVLRGSVVTVVFGRRSFLRRISPNRRNVSFILCSFRKRRPRLVSGRFPCHRETGSVTVSGALENKCNGDHDGMEDVSGLCLAKRHLHTFTVECSNRSLYIVPQT